MGYHSITVIVASLFLCMLFCSFKTDSVAIEKAVNEYYITRPDSVLKLLDYAEKQKCMSAIRIDFLRAIIYESLDMQAIKETCLRRILSAKETVSNPNLHLKTLTMLVETLEKQNKYEEGIKIAMKSLELAKSQGIKSEEYSILCAMS